VLPLNQFALEFSSRIPYHDYEGIALDLDERERLVRDLGSSNALVLRSHGLLLAAETIPGAFYLFFYLGQTARVQMDVMASGGTIVPIPQAVQEHTAQQSVFRCCKRRAALPGKPALRWVLPASTRPPSPK
jgi:ribulose-5-phosphate 4-epimerase/fuculose-1-phosphate aldolase